MNDHGVIMASWVHAQCKDITAPMLIISCIYGYISVVKHSGNADQTSVYVLT